jgi:hypothetical protein
MIRQLLVNIELKLGEYNELDGRMKYVGICALFCLHYQLYRIDDKRQFKLIWDVYKKKRKINFRKYDFRLYFSRYRLFIFVEISVGYRVDFYLKNFPH